MPGGMGCGRVVGATRRIYLVGARGGDAAGRRELRVFARGVRAGAHGPDDVVFVCVADADSGAAVSGVGGDWIFAVCVVFVSAGEVRREGGFGRIGARAGFAVVPTDRFDRADFAVFVGGSYW